MSEGTAGSRSRELACGLTYDEILREYDLIVEDILAFLDYAAKAISGEEVRAVGWDEKVRD